MKIIIYATHSFGTYEKLKEDPDIIILGFGTKWKGFIEKTKVIQEYLITLPENEIVVIIDGFDSYIKKKDGIREEFNKMNCKVLVSKDNIPNDFISKYVFKKIFYKCKDDINVNAGLMMGYVKYLKIIEDKIINGPTKDDQRNLNLACKDLPFLKIDTEYIIFENCWNMDKLNKSNAYFCQIPGTISYSRIVRSITEYGGYFIPEMIGFAIIIALIYINIPLKQLKRRIKS